MKELFRLMRKGLASVVALFIPNQTYRILLQLKEIISEFDKQAQNNPAVTHKTEISFGSLFTMANFLFDRLKMDRKGKTLLFKVFEEKLRIKTIMKFNKLVGAIACELKEYYLSGHLLMAEIAPTPNRLKYQYKFSKVEVALHAAFIAYVAYEAFFSVMPRLTAANPPPEQNLSESIFSPLLGRKRDSHDDQWEAFRSNLPIMILTMFGWKIVVGIYARIYGFLFEKERENLLPAALQKQQQSMLTSFWLGLGMLVFSYRGDIFLYLTLIMLWYWMTKLLYKNKIIIPLSWAIMIAILYLNEKYDHLRFISAQFEKYVPIEFMKNRQAPLLWTNILNMNFLRMISFTMDCYWGDQSELFEAHKKKCDQCLNSNLCYKGRDLAQAPEMTVRKYLDYMLFAPACLAGPPISYKSFHSFKSYPTNKSPPYIRWGFLVVFFQLYQHYYPVITPSKDQNLLEMGLCSLLFLYFIYLKFSVIWKTGRFWALLYGVDVIDNMGRCMFNNYGFEKFWRMWHKGFNHWLVRYLYIPLGGNTNLFSVLSVIMFVGFWHDHTIRILLWALILVLFMIPQLSIKAIFRQKYSHLRANYWFKYLCAAGCAIYIQIICLCNLVGFGYGYENAWVVVSRIGDEWLNFIKMSAIVISACVLMFAVRRYENPRRND